MEPRVRARQLNDQRRHHDALALAEQLIDDNGLTVELDLIRGDALAGLEQFRDAYEIGRNVLEHGGNAMTEAARGLQAHALRRSSRYIDDALEGALDAAAAAERRDGEAYRTVAGRARIDAARVFGRKRCRALAERELDLAAEALDGDARVDYHRGFVALEFDDRPAARETFARVVEAGDASGGYHGALGLAYVEFVMGEFDAAHSHLDSLGELPRGALWPRRLRARLFAAEQRWSACGAALSELIAASPHADGRWADELERATCEYRRDSVAEATNAFAQVAERAPNGSYYGTQARRMAGLLAHPESAHRARRRLKEFPSTTQLRDHCGPASCELYLRYFGLTADQIEIARAIKSPEGGTPVYKMRRCLDSAGFETRRIEAELPRIKALIDAGVPVIVEESYSSTNHVAVAIGYDDARELLEVQDPMTHKVRETNYEDLAEIRNLSNHGALVGVPGGDAAAIAALDEAGATECEYIALTDEAWAAHDAGDGARGDQLVDRAIELHREYELAWLYRFRRARERAHSEDAPDARLALHQLVNEVVSIWPDDEWPQQLLGQVLYVDDRTSEALVAFERARDRDDPDPYNWSMIADCHLRAGNFESAYKALVEAVARDPAYVRANENLADMAMRRGRLTLARALNDVALELQPDNYFNHGIRGQLLERIDPAEALMAYARALAMEPDRDWVATHRGQLLARIGRVDEAVETFEDLVTRRDGNLELRIDLADLLYSHDRSEQAIAVCESILADDDGVAAAHAIRAGSRAKLGQLDDALAGFAAALARRPVYPWVYGEMGQALRAAGRRGEALQALAAALGLSDGAAKWQYELGDALVEFGHAEDGVRHLRRAALDSALAEDELERVGELIVDTKVGDADEFFEEVEAARGGDLAVLRAHARTLLHVLWAPIAAAPVLAKIAAIDPTDAYALTARGEGLMDAGADTEAEGERLLRAAVAAEPELVYPRRVLSQCLTERGRFGETLELLGDCEPAYTTSRMLVLAHCGVGDLDGAGATIAAFEAAFGAGVGSMMLQFCVARRRWDWSAALALAESISREMHERDDDGRLDRWEEERFECLARLGDDDRARRFGEAQAVDADSLGRLAYAAHKADRLELAQTFADRALRLSPDEPLALAARARCFEAAGDVDACIAVWRHLGEVDCDWHIWQEQLARIGLGTGADADVTAALADAAVANGHLCPWSYGVRGQVRALAGDADGARADLEGAWRLAAPEDREHSAFDVWALRAGLAGDTEAAASLWDRCLAQPDGVVSATDRARVAALRSAMRS